MAPEPNITVSLSAFTSTILIILSGALLGVISYAFKQINKNRYLIDEHIKNNKLEAEVMLKMHSLILTEIGVLKNDVKWIIEALSKTQTKLE